MVLRWGLNHRHLIFFKGPDYPEKLINLLLQVRWFHRHQLRRSQASLRGQGPGTVLLHGILNRIQLYVILHVYYKIVPNREAFSRCFYDRCPRLIYWYDKVKFTLIFVKYGLHLQKSISHEQDHLPSSSFFPAYRLGTADRMSFPTGAFPMGFQWN